MGYSGKDMPARNCVGCHRPLSRYNTGSYCGGCATTDLQGANLTVTSGGEPHIGSRVRMLRQRRGMTLEVLAGLCGLSTAYLSMIENGKRGFDPRYSMILTLASALRVTPAELATGMPADSSAGPGAPGEPSAALVPRNEGRTADHSQYNTDQDLEPRELAGQSAPPGCVSPARPSWEATEDLIDVLRRIQKLSRAVNPEVIGQLQDNLRFTIAQYETLDHSSITPVLVKQRVMIDWLLDECANSGQRRQLYEIAGGTSGLLGYVLVGRGEFALARAYCAEAFQLGDSARDDSLKAWARGTHSFCEYYAGKYEEALRLAQDGLNYARSGPQSVRLTINGMARAMGRLGDTKGVQRAVDQAYEFMSRNDVPSGVPSSIAFECYSAAQTASNAATAYLSLGMSRKVQHYVTLALPDISKSSSSWSRSLVMIDLALSLIQPKEGDLDHAAELVLDALSISAGRPVISVQFRAAEFARAAVARWGAARQVSAVRDAISSLKAAGVQHE